MLKRTVFAGALAFYGALTLGDLCLASFKRLSDDELIAARLFGRRADIDSVAPIVTIEDAFRYLEADNFCCSVSRFDTKFVEHPWLWRALNWQGIEVSIRYRSKQPDGQANVYEVTYAVDRCGTVRDRWGTTVEPRSPVRAERSLAYAC